MFNRVRAQTSVKYSFFKTFEDLDPRWIQIAIQTSLLLFGGFYRDFSIQFLSVLLTFAVGLLVQAFWVRALKLKNIGFLSAIITCLGLTLLLRSDWIWPIPLIALVAMSSKFLIRFRGAHLFNPANLGVVLGLTLLPHVWLSPGQWGSDVFLLIFMLIAGSAVVSKAHRSETSWSFLGFYFLLLLYRTIAFGYDGDVLFHQLTNGAVLVFAFLMVSDPMTTPNARGARILHALLVAVFAYIWQFKLFNRHGLIWALFFISFLVPIMNMFWHGSVFRWKNSPLQPVRSIS